MPSQPTELSMKNLIEVLMECNDEIFRRWIPAIRRAAPETRKLRIDELRDSLPLILDQIVHALTGGQPPETGASAHMHGEYRWEEGFSLQTVLLEYSLLQQAIQEVATERLGRPLERAEAQAIEDVRLQALGESISAYATAKEAELRRAGEHKSRLLTALSHDVRTPLNAIMLSLTYLEMNDRLRPEDREALRAIRAGSTAILDLLRDVLDLSKLESGRFVLEETTFDLDAAIAEGVEAVRALATYKGLETVLELKVGARVRTDRARLMQIVGNLLSNAIRYTERGRIVVRSGRAVEEIRIEIEDTGVGIAPEDQTQIFEEFNRVGRSSEAGERGSGLGLSISRRVAQALGGTITVASAPGQGSTFVLSLPTSILSEAEETPEPTTRKHSKN